MLHLLRILDRATGYVFVPPTAVSSGADGANAPNAQSLFGSIAGPVQGEDARDVQERWVDERETYDAWEREEWKKEAERVGRKPAGAGDGEATAGLGS